LLAERPKLGRKEKNRHGNWGQRKGSRKKKPKERRTGTPVRGGLRVRALLPQGRKQAKEDYQKEKKKKSERNDMGKGWDDGAGKGTAPFVRKDNG